MFAKLDSDVRGSQTWFIDFFGKAYTYTSIFLTVH